MDYRNVITGCATAVIISIAILIAMVTTNAQNTRRDREHIAACTSVANTVDRAVCLGRQP